MQKFIAKFGSLIQGVISGADRLVFRGTLRSIQYGFGMMGYLWHKQVPLTAFGKHAEQVTKQIKEASLAEARRLQRPVQYLNSSKIDKKTLAEQIAMRDGIEKGLICVLSCVEPCLSFEVGPNAERQKLELKYRWRKCLFLYHYWMHPLFGFMSARLQTWFPFQVQIYLNGREWLSRQMTGAGIQYVRQENCFPWIEYYPRAQALVDQQLQTDWPQELGMIAAQLNPLHEKIFERFPANYYWSVAESEWARALTADAKAVASNPADAAAAGRLRQAFQAWESTADRLEPLGAHSFLAAETLPVAQILSNLGATGRGRSGSGVD